MKTSGVSCETKFGLLGFLGHPIGQVGLDSTAVSIFVVVLIELTNTVFVNSTNITTNIETALLFRG